MVIIKIAALLFVALVAGGWMMGALLVTPAQKNLSAKEYVAVQQANTDMGKRYFPIVVITSIILLGVLTYMSRADKLQLLLFGICTILMVAALGFTGARMVPINNRVESWSAQNPPSNWSDARDSWRKNHYVRTGIAVTAFVVLSSTIVVNSQQKNLAKANAKSTSVRLS